MEAYGVAARQELHCNNSSMVLVRTVEAVLKWTEKDDRLSVTVKLNVIRYR